MTEPAIRVRLRTAIPYVVFVYALHLTVALIAAYPASAIATRAFSARPDGDAALFAPGSMLLAELHRLHGAALETWAAQAMLVVALMVPVGIASNALLLAALSLQPGAKLPEVVARGAESLRSLAITWVLYAAASGGLAALTYTVAEGVRGSSGAGSTPGRDIAAAVVLIAGVVLWLAGGVAHDVTKAAIVRGGLDVPGALLATVRALRTAWPALYAAWWARAAASLLLVLLEVAALRSIVWLTTSGASVSALLHQLVVIALLVLRVSWLARALELSAGIVDGKETTSGASTEELKDTGIDRAARTGEPGDPS